MSSVRYGSGPLLVPAEVISPYCGSYLELIMKTDQLMGMLELQRLRRYITNPACDREFARLDRLLKAVSRTAFELAKGLRRRSQIAQVETSAAEEPIIAPQNASDAAAPDAAPVDPT